MAETPSTAETSPKREFQAVVSRVLSLSTFFVGVGLYATIGLGLHQTGLLAAYGLTYFAVGGAVGIVGILLWLIAR